MPESEVAVVICHHTGRLLLRCLDSVQQSQGIKFLTIVITSDPTAHRWMPSWVTLYYEEGGPAHKRNVGVARSTSPYVVFLDDDVEISPYCLYEFWHWMVEHPHCGMTFGKIYKMAEGRRREFDDAGSWITNSGFLWARAGNCQVDTGQYNRPLPILASKSATCGVRRNAYLDAGGFDASYYILGEETDLAWRLWLRGWSVWYVPTALSWHAFGCSDLKPKSDFYSLRRVHFLGCRNYLSLLLTNCGGLRLLAVLPGHAIAWCVAAAGFLLRGDWPRCKLILQAIWNVGRDIKQILHKRQLVQTRRKLPDRKLWPLVAYQPALSYYGNRMCRYWTTQLHG